MFNGAMYWSGEHVCNMLSRVVSTDTFNSCVGHQQSVGAIVAMWAVLLVVYWRLFAKSS